LWWRPKAFLKNDQLLMRVLDMFAESQKKSQMRERSIQLGIFIVSRKLSANALTLLIGLFLPSVVQASTFTDTEFADADWAIDHIRSGVGAGAGTLFDAFQETSGGNPDAYRYSSQVHGGARNGTMWTWLFNFDQSSIFDPSLGSLDALSIDFDAIIFTATTNGVRTGPSFGPAIRQGDRLFTNLDLSNIPIGRNGTFGWEEYEFDSLTESNFLPAEFAFQGATVDVSTSGLPIEFGYYSLIIGNFTAGTTTGVDNWRLEVNPQPVPEPTTLAIWSLLFGVAISMLRCRHIQRFPSKACQHAVLGWQNEVDPISWTANRVV
jgi:hypothetical protein